MRHPRRLGALLGAILVLSLPLAELTAAAPPSSKVFKSPRDAVDALLGAAALHDPAEVLAILGPEGKDVIFSGDATADRTARDTFLGAAKEKTVLVDRTKTSVVLEVGANAWPFPIPIVKGPKGWFFDTAAGKEELISRRIGRNELSAIALCQAFVAAQKEYAAGSGTYAQKILSSEGTHDGLYWPAQAGEPESPLGPLAAEAAREGYETKASASGPRPFHGYLFKVLMAQGKDAPGGAKPYVVDGKMTGGFALVAWPAEHGVSGIMTFVVNQAGIVFEKDLGPRTPEIAASMVEFDPDLTWRPTKL